MVPLGFSPEGAMLVAPGIRGTVVSNLTTGARHVLEGQPDDVFKFALSTDGKRFVSSTVNGNVPIWDMTSGKISCQLPARHGQGAATLMFSHDDTRSLTGDQEDTIRLRNMQTRELLQTIQGRGIDAALNLGGIISVFKPSFIQNDAALQQIVLWNVSANQRAHQWSGGDRSLAFTPNRRILASGSTKGIITPWGVK
jgi:WD40 repeat protein